VKTEQAHDREKMSVHLVHPVHQCHMKRTWILRIGRVEMGFFAFQVLRNVKCCRGPKRAYAAQLMKDQRILRGTSGPSWITAVQEDPDMASPFDRRFGKRNASIW